MLFVHKEKKGINDKKTKTFIFGAFVKCPWWDQLKYQGDNEGFLFSLLPKFRTFYSFRGKGE